MILIIGKEHCSACSMTKTVLSNKGIEFEYKLLNDLEESKQQEYLQMASRNNITSMPLIIKDDKISTLQEVIA